MRNGLKYAALALFGLAIAGGVALRILAPPAQQEPQGLVGVQVGVQVGEQVGGAVGVSSPSSAFAPQIVILGDSNAAGFTAVAGSNPPADQSSPGFDPLTPQSTAVVYYDGKSDPALDNPPVYTEITGGVVAWPFSGDHEIGVEISLGKDLTASGMTSVLAKQGVISLQCAQMVPSPSPAYPSTGPSWHSTLITFLQGLEAAKQAQTQIAIVSADNNDGLNTTLTANIAANNSLLANGLVSNLPHLKAILWLKINADTVNFAGFNAAAITNQANWFAANPTVGGVPITPINWDALPLRDHAHATANSYMTLGQWLAKATRDALGVSWPRPTTTPAIVGYGPIAAANGTTQPMGWGGAEAGDLELLFDVQMVGSGTEGTTTTPSGWTSRGSVVATTGSPGFQDRLTIWSRVVDSTMLNANHGHTAATSIVMDSPNTEHWSQIVTIRGPNLNPTIDFVQASGLNASGTSYTLTGGTTTHSNDLIVVVSTGFPSPQVNVSTTLGSSNVTGVAQIKHGTHSDTSFMGLMDIQAGALAAAGATGNIPVTLGGSTITPASAVIAIAP